MPFSFWKYLFLVWEIFTFLYYANEESDDIIVGSTKTVQTLNQEYLQKYSSSVLQTWHQKHTSQKKQNDTYSVVAVGTLLAPVSFCEKTKYPPLQSFKMKQRV